MEDDDLVTDTAEAALDTEERIVEIIARAHRMGRIKDGLVLCDNCGNPACLSLSITLSWTACSVCVWGEADSFDPEDVIPCG